MTKRSRRALERRADPEVIKGRGRCPNCASTNVIRENLPEAVAAGSKFYGPELEICGTCNTAWEPMPAGGDHLDSDGSPFPFPFPCDNCAFRPGSPEQSDPLKWRELIDNLKRGATFYCHKGVPINPDSPDGFDYPKRHADTPEGGVEVPDKSKLRICRGYLRFITTHWSKIDGTEETSEGSPTGRTVEDGPQGPADQLAVCDTPGSHGVDN